MDEDQQQEGQQEQKISSSAFTSFNITSAPRRPISSLALFQRQSAESDEQIRGVVRKNQSAINTINLTLVNVTSQLRELSLSLVKVSAGIKESAAIENLRIAQEQKQAQMLADRNARRGTENILERGIQAALFAPVQRIGAKVRFTLGRLISFFNILLGGFLVGRVIKTIEALVKGDEKALKGIGDVIVKQLTAAGAIFVAINGGLGLAIRSLTQLAFFMGRVAISNLLLKPITLIFSVAKAAAAALVALAAAGLGNLPIPPIGGNQRPPNVGGNRKPKGPLGGNLTNILAGLGLRQMAINQGTDPTTANAQFLGGLFTAGGLNAIGRRLQRSPNRFARLGGSILSTGSGIFGMSAAFSPQLISILDQAEVSNAVSGNVNNFDDIFKNIEQSNMPDIEVVTTQRPSQPVSAEGRGALLMVTPSINDKNPYILNSHLLYNVIL